MELKRNSKLSVGKLNFYLIHDFLFAIFDWVSHIKSAFILDFFQSTVNLKAWQTLPLQC